MEVMSLMRFHPIVSIFLGVIACYILRLIGINGFGVTRWVGAVLVLPEYSWFGTYLIIVSFILGGFIATYFAKERNMRYGLFEGIIIILLLIFLTVPIGFALNKYTFTTAYTTIFATITILLLASLGGMLGQMTDKTYNGFSPILTVIAGFVIALLCSGLLNLMTGFHLSSTPFGLITFLVGVISVVIGSYVTILLAKEKKIQYGIYTGIVYIIISILNTYFYHINIPGSYYIQISVIIGLIVGYLFSAVIGSYLGIIATKLLKQDT